MITVRKSLAASGAVLLLAACGRPENPSVPAEPASAPPAAPAAGAPAELAGVDLTRPIRALGTEPFWALDVTEAGDLKLTGVDRPETVAPRPTRAAGPAGTVLSGRAGDGRELTLTLAPGPCSDGMSDRTYPLTAVVALAGETLKGCAAATDALARAGEGGEVR